MRYKLFNSLFVNNYNMFHDLCINNNLLQFSLLLWGVEKRYTKNTSITNVMEMTASIINMIIVYINSYVKNNYSIHHVTFFCFLLSVNHSLFSMLWIISLDKALKNGIVGIDGYWQYQKITGVSLIIITNKSSGPNLIIISKTWQRCKSSL